MKGISGSVPLTHMEFHGQKKDMTHTDTVKWTPVCFLFPFFWGFDMFFLLIPIICGIFGDDDPRFHYPICSDWFKPWAWHTSVATAEEACIRHSGGKNTHLEVGGGRGEQRSSCRSNSSYKISSRFLEMSIGFVGNSENPVRCPWFLLSEHECFWFKTL